MAQTKSSGGPAATARIGAAKGVRQSWCPNPCVPAGEVTVDADMRWTTGQSLRLEHFRIHDSRLNTRWLRG